MRILSKEINSKTIKKLEDLRNTLLLNYSEVEDGSGLKKGTYSKIARELVSSGLETIGAIILFFGFEYHEFFDFSKPLPSEAALKKRMERFHKAHGSTAYEVIYKQPELSEVIEHRLLHTSLFDNWVNVETISAYLKTSYGYEYGNVSAGLLGAVKSQLLISRKKRSTPDSKSRYNEYKRYGEG
ncbi:hypothetical protein SAMN05216436_101265 [bacterium A37T11]|nr:hypothetical protein SAMN05216436_101265 [bacterium A37T11]